MKDSPLFEKVKVAKFRCRGLAFGVTAGIERVVTSKNKNWKWYNRECVSQKLWGMVGRGNGGNQTRGRDVGDNDAVEDSRQYNADSTQKKRGEH